MNSFFLEDPMLAGMFAPVFVEGNSCRLPVKGEIPKDLCGTLFRNGPNPQFAPREHYHWFSGDGMIHAFSIEDGSVTYRNRWVRTPKWLLEQKAKRSLFAAFGNPYKSDPLAHGRDSGVANTHVIYHGGKLLALEESHLPFEVQPNSLESIGYHTFGGRLPLTLEGRFTAHPKIDPLSGEMVGFSYSGSGLFGPRMSLIVINKNGELVRQEFFDAPYCAFVHDFMLTASHVVFPVLPLVGSMERARSGRPAYLWESNRPGYLGVVGRHDAIETMRWIEVDPCFVFHIFNAWTVGDRIVCDLIKHDRPSLFDDATGLKANGGNLGRPVRWTIDLREEKGCVQETALSSLTGEFPRIDGRYETSESRHGYFAVSRPELRGELPIYSALAHIDLRTTIEKVYSGDPGDGFSEPVFVPSSDGAAEGQGYLLSIQYRARDNTSELIVLDAQNVDREPLARVAVGQRVPAGFHGSWVPAPS